MKKLITLIIVLILAFPVSSIAAEKYVSLTPYPYSTHVLGEDLVIYGNTNLSVVSFGLYYPVKGGYSLKFYDILSPSDLKGGYTISTASKIDSKNPEGVWKAVVQYGEVRDEIDIVMTSTPVFNRYIRIAEYNENTLTDIVTYPCRGMQIKNGVMDFTLEDETQIRIFSWDNLSPTDNGETTLFIAQYKDGYMTSVKNYKGELTDFGYNMTLVISETERLEIFYWNDNLIPVN